MMNSCYDVLDCCWGIVTGRCQKGAFLELDNGEPAFCYKVCNLRPGTEVLCTVLKLAFGEKKMLVSIDSIFDEVML